VPDSFPDGLVVSISKRGKDPKVCVSLRLITTFIFFSKIFKYILLPDIAHKCDFTSYQLGYHKDMGCNQAHYILTKLMEHAVKDKYPLYLCVVDISSAFDNVVYSQAIFRLFRKGLN
jgi:hypothetical protein